MRAALRKLLHAVLAFLRHPWMVIRTQVRRFSLAIWAVLQWLYRLVVSWLKKVPALWWRRIAITVAVTAVVVIALFIGAMMYVESAIALGPLPDTIHYSIHQGWGASPSSPDRETYYHTPQGSYVRNLRYEWMEHLERPWSTRRFGEPVYMRAYGFVTDDAQIVGNGAKLPVGFAARYDATLGETMLDLSCAACHTGELMYVTKGVRTAVRIEGGSAHHDLFTQRPGFFAGDLAAALLSTYYNPFKWRRFRTNILHDFEHPENHDRLRAEFGAAMWNALGQAFREWWLGVYPVVEGYGRTDGLGRILNNTFALNVSQDNYRVANAPVSYPPVWNMWKFDWVQYMGSVRQPMARNIGESMGTGATFWLHDPYGKPVPDTERYNASTLFANLSKLESALQRLKPPCWPEEVFGKVDTNLATQGQALFQQHCAHCHQVQNAKKYVVMRDAPGKIAVGAPHWLLNMIPLQEIGTDPQSALNFVRYRVDLSATGLTAGEIREALTPYHKEQYARLLAYYPEYIADPDTSAAERMAAESELAKLKALQLEGYLQEQLGSIDVTSMTPGAGLNYLIKLIRDQAYKDMGIPPEDQPEWDGFGQLDIPQVILQYKARPLSGIWSTPPFLHNGSVPTIYDLLLPAYRRPKTFYVKAQDYDPVHLGLEPNQNEKNAQLLDTTVVGNSNSGHEFRAGYQPWRPDGPTQYGVIGPELTDPERFALIEYLKVHRDDLATQSCPVQIPQPPLATPATTTGARR